MPPQSRQRRCFCSGLSVFAFRLRDLFCANSLLFPRMPTLSRQVIRPKYRKVFLNVLFEIIREVDVVSHDSILDEAHSALLLGTLG